ncbi:MAG: hypothetical protein COS88_02740 [Chloroflexi bacterium CG07_land_8_20_14_0_80_51_10]|nr:MAG: hypothetical protein COS88_02740 [Chloroflexi bacterium CG07_land_8_20_14_0_80_51_10]
MSEWLGKSRIEEKDIQKSMPSMVKYFPMLTRYYVDNQKLRINLALPYDMGEEFKLAVIKTYGAFNPTNVRKASMEAIDHWIETHL